MRLYDKLLNVSANTAKLAESTVVVVADAIARHVDEEMKHKPKYDVKDFPSSRMPWEFCFVEWSCPGLPGEMQQWGWFCASHSTSAARLELAKHLLGSHGPLDEALASWEPYADIVMASPYSCVAGKIGSPGFFCLWIYADDGSLVECKTLADKVPAYDPNKMAGRFAIPAWTTFMFSNCCNVRLEDVTDDVQPPPKIRRRLKLPEVKRYTLNIAGHVSRPSREYNDGTLGVMPFHLCRGHFATYTPERPMFGNPKLVGRYWHPPHMKGKKENGEIVKDYAIKG